MKRIVSILLCIFAFSMIFAELNPPHRYLEAGVDVNASAGNNWFNLSDFQNEVLVIDFTEMANNLKNGYLVELNTDTKAYFNINSKKIHFGFFTGVEEIGAVQLSQDLINFLGKGNAEGDHSINAAVGMDMSVYVEAGLSMKTFWGKLGLGITPTMFAPVVYVPRRDSSVSVSFNDDASINVKTNASVAVYSPFGMSNDMADENGITLNSDEIFHDAGLDISLSAEYALKPSLDIGFAVNHIPSVPAKLRYKMEYEMEQEFNFDSIIDMATKSEEEPAEDVPSDEDFLGEEENDIILPEPAFEALEIPYSLYRPVELSVAAAYRPFGEWFDVNGSLGVVFYKPAYLNYSFGAGLHLVKMCKLGGHLIYLSLTSAFDDRVWTQQFDFALNLRVLEITFKASSCGTEFAKSFTGSGLGVGVGIKMGI